MRDTKYEPGHLPVAGVTKKGVVIPSEDGIQVLPKVLEYRIQNLEFRMGIKN